MGLPEVWPMLSVSLSFGSTWVRSFSPWLGQSGLGTAVWCRSSSLSPVYTEGSCWWFEKKRPSHSCESTGTSQWFALDTSFPSDGSTLRRVEGREDKRNETVLEECFLTWSHDKSEGFKMINRMEEQGVTFNHFLWLHPKMPGTTLMNNKRLWPPVIMNTKNCLLSVSVSYQAGVCSHAHFPSRWTWRLLARWPEPVRCQAGAEWDGAQVWAGAALVEEPVSRDKTRW